MNRKSGAFSLLWTNGKQGGLASDGIPALAVGLLALAMAIVAIVWVVPQANPGSSLVVAAAAAPAKSEVGFGFLDHELAYAGGYGLVAAGGEAGFDFLDHELAYAGGYGLVAGAGEAGFDFLDHELAYAGGYGLVAQEEQGGRLLLRLL